MLKVFGKLNCFLGGLLVGTAGVKALSTNEARTVYVHTAAAGLRAKDCALATATKLREEAEDVLEDAKRLNEKKAVCCEKEVIEDLAGVAEAD